MYTARERNSGCNVPDKYHWYPVLRKKDARLSENGLLPEQRESAWNKLHNHLFSYQNTFLGFQVNQSFDSERTKPFLDIALNNCGDPFSPSSQYATNTKVMECAVLDYFAKLWGIQQSDASNEEERAYWGYITSNGGSEGNLLALFNARDYLAGMPLNDPILDPDSSKSSNRGDLDTNETRPIWEDNGHSVVNRSNNPRMNAYVSSHDHRTENLPLVKDNPNNFIPVVFLAEESYHGFEKALRVLQMKTFRDLGSGNFPCPLKYPNDYPSSFNDEFLDQNGWPRAVPVETDGSISIPCLVKLVTAFVSRGFPPLVVFTCGTTFKGANDNPQAAISELVPILKEHGMYERRVYSPEHPTKSDTRNGFWFHVDGALGGAHLRFLEMAIKQGLVHNMFPNVFPVFDFRIPEVKSIAMSLHKWFGCPVPAAVFMMRKKDQVKPPNNPLYIGGLDSTLSGSRGGYSVLVMWDLLSKKSYDDFKEIAVSGVQMVAFSLKKLQELQKELSLDLWLSHTPGSLFVYFRQPREDIVLRYSLGSEPLKVKTVDGTFEQRIYSHICLMPHVTNNLVLRFIEELRGPGAFPIQN
jgi:histidine decarboxylase